MRKKPQPPARTPEARQNQLISLAVDEAERRLRDGSASSQIITTLLHWASTRNQLELEKIRRDIELSKSKEMELQSRMHSDEKYNEALEAFKSYQGSNFRYDEDYDEFD